jgi:hypothetical protein
MLYPEDRNLYNHCSENLKSTNNDLVCSNLFTIAMNSFYIWNCNILKSSYPSYTTTFHIGIVHEHFLRQCATHAQHLTTGNNTTRSSPLITQVKNSSNSNLRLRIYAWVITLCRGSLHQQSSVIYWGHTERKL